MNDIVAIREQLSSYKVLIVDDEVELRKSIEEIFESFFGEVVSAIDGKDALEKFHEQGPFDMLITDISMPKMNGIELAKELRSLDKELFIIVMSGAFDDYPEGLDTANVLTGKPFTFDEITKFFLKFIEYKNTK